MAEARFAVTEPRIYDLDEGRDSRKDFIRETRKAIVRRFFRTRNLVRNGMYPTSLWNLGVTVGTTSAIMATDLDVFQSLNARLWSVQHYMYLPSGTPFYVRIFLISSTVGFAFFFILLHIRRYLLRALLSYKGWLYEQPKKQSWTTKIWGVLVRLIGGGYPLTYSYQYSLPRQSVPAVSDTVNKLLESVEPVLEPDKVEQMKLQAKEFEKTLAPKLQRILVLKSWWANNYVTNWWEKYIYLINRSPIAINSNYYCLDHAFWQPTTSQVARAATQICTLIKVKQMVEREHLRPLVIRGTIPLCMNQYERAFSTVRIPGEEMDELVHYDSYESKHIVVMRKGLYYKLDMYDVNGQVLAPMTAAKQLEWIIEDADKQLESNSLKSSTAIAALTANKRDVWARVRKQYFSNGVNKESISWIDKAAFMVVLETKALDTFSERGKHLLHGDGSTIWFDKSFTVVYFSNGKCGANAEHSWGDAPVVGHILEHAMSEDVLAGKYDPYGYCLPFANYAQGAVRSPMLLQWEITEPLGEHIQQSLSFAQKNNDDLDLFVINHDDYGKGFVKKCKVSPDAYIQLALQLAYYRDAGHFALTYESSMTRLYLHGRTETVRSLTKAAAEFVRAMEDKDKSNEERIALMRKAAADHQTLYRDCMSGKGCDRHLFALFVLCKGLGNESEFLHTALTLPWTLSTSQTPQQQIESNPSVGHPCYRDMASPGGGFGPVSDSGYGVSYMIPEDSRFFFHVSSKKSCPQTDSKRFVDNIFKALADMKSIFKEVIPDGVKKH
ncbi:carnitine O-palmitoyltransferase 1, liver isoform-like isoform X2 [Ptychodera flava]|uniref:carnitine O-palmitoyltransferase 1, liver isoform-like isoform X2 n=1 Tax=Ptychodera flava TaxID=63121 RepID=UPI00396A33DA